MRFEECQDMSFALRLKTDFNGIPAWVCQIAAPAVRFLGCRVFQFRTPASGEWGRRFLLIRLNVIPKTGRATVCP